MNMSLARKILETLAAQGVEDILLCAGARNSPLVVLLEKSKGFRILNFFEERSAGFFALGRSQRDRRPVAIVTTSGTAVAELIPSAVEATYTQTPLIYVTADRPRSYRGTGAPQSIDQVGIFFKYVETCVDIAHLNEELDLSLWTRTAPLQINVCFDEPLIDEPVESIDFSKIPKITKEIPPLSSTQTRILNQPLVIAGPLTEEEADFVTPFLDKLGAPIYAESLSHLRNQETLQRVMLQSGDKIVKDLFLKGHCQSLLRVGGIPTLRFWRDLEDTFQKIPVVSISNSDYTGLSRSVQHLVGLQNFPLIKVQWAQDPRAAIFALDRSKRTALENLFLKYPQSEPSLLAIISSHLRSEFIYLGNSLPIREWDLVSPFGEGTRLAGNRGANGIDGQISSFLGGATPQNDNWAFVGDLTAMYDLASLWVSSQLDPMKMRIVVVNNHGGQIFKNIFEKEIFLNRHQIDFSHWAKMWKWEYHKWEKIPSTLIDIPQRTVIELVPDNEQSHLFWQEYKQL